MKEISKIKQFLLGNLIGIVNPKETVSSIDELILNDHWHDSFTELMSEGFYIKENILGVLGTENYQLCDEDLKLFEMKFYPFLIAQNPEKNWKEIEERLYQYIKLKIELLNLSSNDLKEDWFSLINDYELRSEKLEGVLDMPNDLIQFLLSLNSEIWNSSFSKTL